MTGDVFISHSSRDKTVADAMCARLEQRGLRCWIAPRDITPGMSYAAAILDAINAARVMVVVLSAHANVSRHVVKEVERAVSKGVVIIPFRVEDAVPGKDLEFFLSTEHWLDAIDPPLERHVQRLGDIIAALLPTARPARPESEAERARALRSFEEVAPDEWRWRSRSGFSSWVRRLLADRT